MLRICCYCGDVIGEKPGGEGVTHGVCSDCLEIQQEAIEAVIQERDSLRARRALASQDTDGNSGE